MTKILVAEDNWTTRQQLVDILFRARYDVVEVDRGDVVIEKVTVERPDLILMEVDMHSMSGLEVLRGLRGQPDIGATPVIMMASESNPRKGQVYAWALGVNHYIITPMQLSMVELAVRITLRESEAATDDTEGVNDSITWRGSTIDVKQPSVSGPPPVISTGIPTLDSIMNGGIPLGSMTLIEGTPSVGKSVLCQHVAYESLQDDHRVAYFSSSYTASGLSDQMRSLGLDVSGKLRSDNLRIFPLREPALDGDCQFSEAPEQIMGSLIREMELLPNGFDFIIVDAITNVAMSSEDRAILRFSPSCRRLCNGGRAIVVVTQPHAFDEAMLDRIRNLCDGYLSLRAEMMGTNMGTMLEVLKANNVDLSVGNTVSFDVQPEVGIRNLSFSRVKL